MRHVERENAASPISQAGVSPPQVSGPDASQNIAHLLSEYVLVKRAALSWYYFVLVGCTLGGLAIGWLAASSLQQPKAAGTAAKPASSEPVLLSGEIRFVDARGMGHPDTGAVVIALPAKQFPDSRVPIEGLRPWDSDSPQRQRNLEKLAEHGGAWTTVEEDGQFRLVLPETGDYWVLVISKNLARPKSVTEQPNRGIGELDLAQLSRYFERPVDLIGPQEYSWSLRSVDIGGGQIHHIFDGRSWKDLDKIQ
ncbi:MAG: hypothetical protein H5U08_02045 [Thermogutta sp.]|uniref:hypothetical protein n=1 Tax=Thermogutta sp. TaxID=1962930 RepID=UPI0019CACFB8|nr:hypothetical protein [Thermogutta sp.]MBC7351115.1 hypothetical protein [Thermogutta sp.]